MPTRGRTSHCPVMKATTARPPPRASAPVSPLNTPGGVGVVPREAQPGARHREAEGAQERLLLAEGDEPVRTVGDGRGARGQAVQPIGNRPAARGTDDYPHR